MLQKHVWKFEKPKHFLQIACGEQVLPKKQYWLSCIFCKWINIECGWCLGKVDVFHVCKSICTMCLMYVDAWIIQKIASFSPSTRPCLEISRPRRPWAGWQWWNPTNRDWKSKLLACLLWKTNPKNEILRGFFPTNLKNLHCLIPPKKKWVVFFSDPCQMSGDKINVNHLRSLGLFAAKALLALQVDPFLSLCSTVSTFGIVHSFVLSCHISKTISTCFYSSIFDNEMNDVG